MWYYCRRLRFHYFFCFLIILLLSQTQSMWSKCELSRPSKIQGPATERSTRTLQCEPQVLATLIRIHWHRKFLMEDSGRCNKGTQDSEFSYNDIKYDYMIINITYIYVLWYRYSSAPGVCSTLSHNRWAFSYSWGCRAVWVASILSAAQSCWSRWRRSLVGIPWANLLKHIEIWSFWFCFADVTDFQSGCPWAQACGYSFFHNFYILNFQVPNQVRNIRSQRWQEDATEMFTPTMGSMIAQSLNPFQIPAGIVSWVSSSDSNLQISNAMDTTIMCSFTQSSRSLACCRPRVAAPTRTLMQARPLKCMA